MSVCFDYYITKILGSFQIQESHGIERPMCELRGHRSGLPRQAKLHFELKLFKLKSEIRVNT